MSCPLAVYGALAGTIAAYSLLILATLPEVAR